LCGNERGLRIMDDILPVGIKLKIFDIDMHWQAAFISVAAEMIISGYTLPGFLSTFQNAKKKCGMRNGALGSP